MSSTNGNSMVQLATVAIIVLSLFHCILVQDAMVAAAPAAAAAATSKKPKTDNSVAGGLNCTDHLLTIDRCSSMATYSYTTSFNQYPLTASELKASCDRIVDGIKCLKVNGKCLGSFARRSLASYATSRSRHSKKLCTNMDDPKTVDFWKATECIRGKNKRAPMIESERIMISTIQALSTESKMKFQDRLHQACCAASVFKTKALKDMEPECSKYKSVTEEMLDSMLGELLETACPEQPKLSEICSKLPKFTPSKDWKSGSLTSAGLDLIIALADDPKK